MAKAVAQLTIDNRRRWADLPGELAERLSRATLAVVAEIAAGAAQRRARSSDATTRRRAAAPTRR